MFVSIIKYSRKCSFYFLIMSHDNTYKICSCTFTPKCLMRFCRPTFSKSLYLLSLFSSASMPGGGGGHTSISLKGMLDREQISTTQKSRMTLNSNSKKIEFPKSQTQKNRMTQTRPKMQCLSKFE